MTWLLRRLDVDPRQYFALLKLAWRVDMRTSRISFGVRKKGRNPLLVFIFTFLFYIFIGMIFAQVSLTSSSVFLGATLTIGGIMFMLGGMVLVEYSSIVVSPDDYHILGYMPVSSRTYFFAKITNLLFYVLMFSLALGGPTVVVHFFKGGGGIHVVRGVLAAVAVGGAAVFISLGASVLYGWLMRILSPEKLKNIIAYVQFGMSFAIYGGYIVLPDLLKEYTATMTVTPDGWFLLIPTSWFAAVIQLGYGVADPFTLAGTLLAVFALVLLARSALSRISLDYAHRIASLLAQPAGGEAPASSRRRHAALSFQKLFRRPESRVVARLVFAQFRHDYKFRLSVLGIIPLLIMYFYIGAREGTLSDPFVLGTTGLSAFFIFFFAILMIPLLVKQNLEASDAFEASWIFYATPADIPSLILATRNILFALFTLPSLVFIFTLLNYYFQAPLHAFLHTVTIAIISFFILQVVYLLNPRLPFAEPKTRGGRSRLFTFLFFVLPGLGLGMLYLAIRYAYVSYTLIALTFSGALLGMLLLESLTRRRIRYAIRKLQFAN